MSRKRDEFIPLGDVAEAVELSGDRALASRAVAPRARRHFTRLDQVAQLVGVSEADPELGYIARLLALCSLPRTNPGNRTQYVRGMSRGLLKLQRRLDSRLRNHLRRFPEPELRVARSERRHQLRHVLAAFDAAEALGRFQHPGGDPA